MMTTDTKSQFQSKIFNKLTTDQLLVMSQFLGDLSEDMEDRYRIQTTGKHKKKGDYSDANTLDSIVAKHDHQS